MTKDTTPSGVAEPADLDKLLNDDTAAAHIYPSTLKKFEFGEHVDHCYSIKVGSPDEPAGSVGVFTIEQVRTAFAALATSPAEPVAWRHSHTHCLYETREEVQLADGDSWAEPLYLAPVGAETVATLPGRIAELVAQHGSLRAVARVLECDAGYLSRLQSGEKTDPGAHLLRRMGLRQVTTFERIKS